MGNFKAKSQTVFGLQISENEKYFFKGETFGTIVFPQGGRTFGWDCIFKPDGSEQTYGEMALETKKLYSHRQKALKKLMEFLIENQQK